jgi:hypothetical protein
LEAKFAQVLQQRNEARKLQAEKLEAEWLEIEKLEAQQKRADEKRYAEKQRQRAKTKRQAAKRRETEKEIEFTNAIVNQSEDETGARECDIETELGLQPPTPSGVIVDGSTLLQLLAHRDSGPLHARVSKLAESNRTVSTSR